MKKFTVPFKGYESYNSDCEYSIRIIDEHSFSFDIEALIDTLEEKGFLYLEISLYNCYYNCTEPILQTVFGYHNGEYISLHEAFKKLREEAERYFAYDSDSYKTDVGFEGGCIGEIDGSVYYADYFKGFIRIGSISNNGLCPEFIFKYDKLFTLDQNLQDAVSKFTETLM